ncbi:MAG: hypothetical protein P8177_04075 [Gemmatimonadota bacterium]|jgi:hypothetical protein
MNARRRQMLVDGLAAGIAGYLAVVLFVALWNLAAGRSPFFTAALLGEAVFLGLRDVSAVTLDPGMVLAFNGVHLLAFLLFGFFAAWLMYETELHPSFWYLSLALFVAAAVLAYGAIAALTALVGGLVSPLLVVAASLVGAGAVAAYLTVLHRPLMRSIGGVGEDVAR